MALENLAVTQGSDPYHAIADLNRRTILDLLRARGPLRAGEIVDCLASVLAATNQPAISQPAVSKHLRVLREAALVYDVKEGRERWYHLNPDPLLDVAAWLHHYEAVWNERLHKLKGLAEEEEVDASESHRGGGNAGDDD